MSNVYSLLKKRKLIQIVLALSLFFLVPSFVKAQETATVTPTQEVKAFTYFTGIGCPHCAKVSPVIHKNVNAQEGLLMIEYEIYQESSNASMLYSYNAKYGYQLAIPLILYAPKDFDQGDTPILDNFNSQVAKLQTNTIELPNKTVTWEDLNLNDFDGRVKLFTKDKVALQSTSKDLTTKQIAIIKEFLTTNDMDTYVKTLEGTQVKDMTIEYPGGNEIYTHGVNIGSWTLLWRGNSDAQITDGKTATTDSGSTGSESISWGKISALALTDSINPCALSVLLMMLIAIATYHPKDKKQILWTGLAFVAAVFVTYFIYGLLIVKAFEVVQGISSIKLYLYKGLGVGAIILGLLEIKDFFFYKPGSIGTEMPMMFRPKVQQILARVTSPIGAFGLGMFVTLFLLPCTIGPYVILGGMLSYGEFAGALPYLTVYNLIFVLPMVVVILLVFFGSKSIKQVTQWREKNVKVMHLIIGIIFVLLGVSMFFGLF
ncbi:cytochrome c biogenesis CcdA family protein [Patescibacteria group bacterium]|nr:cytochrome c biogenesis CcdA family protein [Patescibacteria group bacterium]